MPGKIEKDPVRILQFMAAGAGGFTAGIDIGYNGIIGCLFIKNSVRLVALVFKYSKHLACVIGWMLQGG